MPHFVGLPVASFYRPTLVRIGAFAFDGNSTLWSVVQNKKLSATAGRIIGQAVPID
jgi:hypothetical protein